MRSAEFKKWLTVGILLLSAILLSGYSWPALSDFSIANVGIKTIVAVVALYCGFVVANSETA